jgi:nitrate/nitrite transporter NarK
MRTFQRRILWAAGLCFAADFMEFFLLSFLTVVLRQDWQLTETKTLTITFSVFFRCSVGKLNTGATW